MSRAFVRESDDRTEEVAPLWPPLAPGVRNYVTPAGAKAMQDELTALLQQKQTVDAANTADVELRKLEHQIRQYQQRLTTLVITPPPASQDVIAFGATVLVRNSASEQTTYRIVGIDETDLDRDWISWQSPLARALVGHKTGDHITFHAPAGRQDLEIVKINYD